MTKAAPKPLSTRLWRARILLKSWRHALYDSHRDRTPGPTNGSVAEPMASELLQFDEAIATLTEVIAQEKRKAKPMTGKSKNPQADVDAWNRDVIVGDLVEYRSYPEAEPQQFKTRTPAQVLSGHTAVVWLFGKAGCVCVGACRRVMAS